MDVIHIIFIFVTIVIILYVMLKKKSYKIDNFQVVRNGYQKILNSKSLSNNKYDGSGVKILNKEFNKMNPMSDNYKGKEYTQKKFKKYKKQYNSKYKKKSKNKQHKHHHRHHIHSHRHSHNHNHTHN